MLVHAHTLTHTHTQDTIMGVKRHWIDLCPTVVQNSVVLTWTTDLNNSWSAFFSPAPPRALAGVQQNTVQYMMWWGEWIAVEEEDGVKKWRRGESREDVWGKGEEGCLFSEATERHLIFLTRPLDQGDLQRDSIKVTLVLVLLQPK